MQSGAGVALEGEGGTGPGAGVGGCGSRAFCLHVACADEADRETPGSSGTPDLSDGPCQAPGRPRAEGAPCAERGCSAGARRPRGYPDVTGARSPAIPFPAPCSP